MWFGLAKIALQTGAKVYSNKQKQKEAMSQAALLTAERWLVVKQNIKVSY